jgi:hypothetical protein
MAFNTSHTTMVLLLLATAFTGVVAGKGLKGVGAQRTTSLPSLRRLDKVKGPSKRDCKITEKDDEIEFECKTKEEDEETGIEIKDKIKFQGELYVQYLVYRPVQSTIPDVSNLLLLCFGHSQDRQG